MERRKTERILAPFLDGQNIYLRAVCSSDANNNYCRWMNDTEVTQYLESRFYPQSVESIASYISKVNASSDSVFFAIVLKDKDIHIGNIKIGSINWIHRYADVGILIGDKTCWGKGFGVEAIKLVVDYAFKKLNLRRLEAGCYSNNIRSIKAFKKAGFIEEGCLRQRYFCEGGYVDRVCLGVVRENWVV
jgi:RimJ/RimL family protein N-acetyltransferase